jgi:hypothetical protein
MTISQEMGSVRNPFDEKQASSNEAICEIGEKDILFVPKNKPGGRRCKAYHERAIAMIVDCDKYEKAKTLWKKMLFRTACMQH